MATKCLLSGRFEIGGTRGTLAPEKGLCAESALQNLNLLVGYQRLYFIQHLHKAIVGFRTKQPSPNMCKTKRWPNRVFGAE